MVRGNWQKRVERTEARRQQNKQRKQKSGEKKLNKAMVNSLFALLDRHEEIIIHNRKGRRRRNKIRKNQQRQQMDDNDDSNNLDPVAGDGEEGLGKLHIWTDMIPNDCPQLLVDACDNHYQNQYPQQQYYQSPPKSAKGSRKPRSSSIESATSDKSINSVEGKKGGKKSRGKDFSGSISSNYGEGKKAHPRSKEAKISAGIIVDDNTNNNNEDITNAPRLCRRHFFSGKCNTGSSCQCIHYPQQCKTLADVVMMNNNREKPPSRQGGQPKSTASNSNELDSSEIACKIATPEEMYDIEPGAMEMVYYSNLVLKPLMDEKSKNDSSANHKNQKQSQKKIVGDCNNNEDNDNGNNNNKNSDEDDDDDDVDNNIGDKNEARVEGTLSERLLSLLSSNSCFISSVVYLAVDDILVFDRNRDGVILSDKDFLSSVIGDGTGGGGNSPLVSSAVLSKNSGADYIDNNFDNGIPLLDEVVSTIPGPVLEHILTFLPDSAVASASQVCKSWYHEIGQISPHIWRHMLIRRQWPMPYQKQAALATATTTTKEEQLSLMITETEIEKIKNQGSGMMSNITNHDIMFAREDASDSLSSQRLLFRDKFISHYTILRDVKAIQMATIGLVSSSSLSQSKISKSKIEEKEMTYQIFSTRRSAPQSPNYCVAVEVWSSDRILAAYSHDCSLRLFKAVARGGGTGTSSFIKHEKSCKELVCLTIDPYRNTKKKSCRLVSMGLDEDFIGCLCHVMEDSTETETYNLAIISKDDYLLCSGNDVNNNKLMMSEPEENTLHVIDIGESVLNYLLIYDEVDHRLLRLHDFLVMGGDIKDIEIIVSQSMVSCGFGRFMVEVAISVPIEDIDVDDEDEENNQNDDDMFLVVRKLFLFSSSANAIVWMGDSNPINQIMRPRHEDMTLACIRRPAIIGGSRTACNVVVASSSSPALMTTEIDPSGHISDTQLVEASVYVSNEMLEVDGWELTRMQHRPIVITPTDFLISDTLVRVVDDNNHNNMDGQQLNIPQSHKQYKSIITFYSRYPGCGEGAGAGQHDDFYKLTIDGNCEVVRMTCFRDDHVVLMSRFYLSESDILGNGNVADGGGRVAVGNAGGGHWGSNGTTRFMVYAIIIHVPTRSEMERICILEDSILADYDRSPLLDIPINITVSGDTVAAALWWKGVIMTGDDVRSLGLNDAIIIPEENNNKNNNSPSKSTKKKKKRTVKGAGGKKDGFARGMNMRG